MEPRARTALVAETLTRDRGAGVVLLLNRPLDPNDGRACREVAHCGLTIVAEEEWRGYLCAAPRL